MDQLKDTYNQARDLFLGMTPGNRVIAALLTAVLLVSIAFLIVGLARAPQGSQTKFLYDGYTFTGPEQRAAQTAFGKAKLTDYDFKAGRLEIPAKKEADFLAALADANIVMEPDSPMTQLLGNASPLISTSVMSDLKVQARAAAAAAVIRKMEGVENATVIPSDIIDRPEGRWDKTKLYSASVTVWSTNNEPLSNEMVSTISKHVATALSITDYSRIAIGDSYGRTYDATDEYSQSSMARSRLGSQRENQAYWEKTVYKALSYIKGVNVTAAVEVDNVELRKGTEIRHQKPAAAVHTRERETDFSKDVENRHARPGMVAQYNQPLNLDMGRGWGSTAHEKEKTSDAEATMALQGDDMQVKYGAYAPRKVNITIKIPFSHIIETWKLQARMTGGEEAEAEPTPEQLRQTETQVVQQVKDEVTNLVRSTRDTENADLTESVIVSTFYDKPAVLPPLPGFVEQMRMWSVENWQMLTLLGVVFAALFVLWALTRPARPEPIVIYEAPEIPAEELERQIAPLTPEEEEELERQRTLNPFDKSMRSLQEEVTELVEENPDAAAAILRQWIGNVVTSET